MLRERLRRVKLYLRWLPITVGIIRWWIDMSHPPAEACVTYECSLCGLRDCPNGSPDHYWHDGCPDCWSCDTNGYRTKAQDYNLQ